MRSDRRVGVGGGGEERRGEERRGERKQEEDREVEGGEAVKEQFSLLSCYLIV